MAPPDPLLGFPAPGLDHGPAEQRSAAVSPRRKKRKTTAGVGDDAHHRPETEAEAEAHRTATAEEGSSLPHPAGQFVEQTEGGSGFLYDNEQRNHHQQQPAAAGNGGTAAQPIVIDDEEVVVAPATAERDGGGSPCPEPEPEQPAVMPLPSCGEKKDKEDEYGGRYEMLSTYLPPPLPDADEEDALRPSAAAVPRYFSPVDVFWGTEDGVWIY